MQIGSNIHTHTVWSDGRDSMETVVETALRKGFHSVGISDHSYTWFDESYCMSRAGTEQYRAEILRLRDQYAGQIRILLGAFLASGAVNQTKSHYSSPFT